MKHFKIIIFTILSLALWSCASDDVLNNETTCQDNIVSSHHINILQAQEIARKVLNKTSTRSINFSVPEVQYVLSDSKTRSQSTPDTLAYVINYTEDSGFAIISSDNRVNPVLAYSDKGNFSFSNENAMENFVSRIGEYIGNAPSDVYHEYDNFDFGNCYIKTPIIDFAIGQREPWDKYVIQEHPGCPVGCVAVASALVMSYSKSYINYHDTKLYLSNMIKAIEKGPYVAQPLSTGIQTNSLIIGTNNYSYEQAVDLMAKFLYWIGKDIDIIYNKDGSFGYFYKAYDLCKSLGFKIPSGFPSYNNQDVVDYLLNKHIIFLGGSNHAWVADGCKYCVDKDDPSIILDAYIHCDWGWYGYGNGYFLGDVFTVDNKEYSPSCYFAVEIEPMLQEVK